MYYTYKNDYFYYKKKKYYSGALIRFTGDVKTKEGDVVKLEKSLLEFICEEDGKMFFKDAGSGTEYIYDNVFYFSWCVNEIVYDRKVFQSHQIAQEKHMTEENCNNILLGIALMVFGLIFYDWWLIWVMVIAWLYFSVIKGGK